MTVSTEIFEETRLEYGRLGNLFRITVFKERSTVFNEEISTSSTLLPHVPWDNVSQQEKLFALANLPDLFEELARKVESESELAERDSGTVNVFLEPMKK